MASLDVNVRRFAYWLAVVDEGSFTRAAQTLQIAQPSLSQQVRALEAEVGGQLIERVPGAIRLTPAGKAFLPEARAVVLGAQRAVRSARAALNIESGELEVATVRSVAVGLLPPSIRIWHDTYPGVTVRLREFAHRDLLNTAVRSGVGDIAIGPRPTEWNGPLVSLGWEEFLLVLPLSDPLAKRRSVPLELLHDRRWVLFPPDHGLSELIHTLCGRAGFRPREAVRTSQVDAAARLAAAGIGPTMVPDNMVHAGIEAAVLHVDPPVVRELVAFTRTEWSPSARGYLEIVHALPWTKPPRDAFAIT
jgi:DNA-binding transcriptional LysR family regulator